MEGSVQVDTVLVPVDGTDESTRAVEYAVAIADRYDAGVHVMYVLEEAATGPADGTDDVLDATDPEEIPYFEVVDRYGASTDVPLTHSIAYGFSTRRLTVHPGSVVLDAAEQMAADFIVIPRERDEESEVLEKAAEYVLLYASQPVLSV